MEEEYLQQLNDQQRSAVTYLDGPQLVIAGAGSGKTRVLTYKIVHLLAHGYEPWRILALTFTNKAAREMRSRIQSLVGAPTASKLWMGTFHAIFARILRSHAERIGYKSNFTIYDDSDSKSLVKAILRDLNLDDKIYKPSTVREAISTAKNSLIGPEDYKNDPDITAHDRNCRRPLMGRIYSIYVERCRVAGAMDFDDLLFYTNVLLRDNPDILRHYQEFFRYVLVDEYQDTNFAQHMIITQLCNMTNNLCVVGDDAQSIYSFRGANIRNILNLERAYPGLRTFKLEQNYRSTQTIINAANSLIDKNTEQIRKNVFSKNSEGERIEVVQSYSDYEEAYLVANRISQVHMSSHDSYNDFAVLYRTNAQSRVLEEALRKRSIPYRIYGGLSFYQRKEIKDAIAYFRMSVNPNDDESLKRIINTPARGIGETTVRKLTAAAIEHKVSIWSVICDPDSFATGLNRGTLSKLDNFRVLIKQFIDANIAGRNAEEMAALIIDRTRLMSSLVTDTTPESISRQENLNELLKATKEFVTDKTEEGFIDDIFMPNFLAEVALATDQDKEDSANEERVTLMTIHAAKGLEFNNIFIVGVEEDFLPSSMSQNSIQEIEEERRLLYVAITRARRFCMITYATSRYVNGQTASRMPSRFLRDIDPRYLHLTTGTSFAGDGEGWQNRSRDARQSYHGYAPPMGNRPTPSWRGGSSRPTVSSPRPSAPAGFTPVSRTVAPTRAASPAGGGDSLHTASELQTGTRILHPRFGAGVVLSIDTSQSDTRIVVEFGNGEHKTLLLKFARFRIL